VEEHGGTVVLRSGIGGERVVDMLSGEQLPRICWSPSSPSVPFLAWRDEGHASTRADS